MRYLSLFIGYLTIITCFCCCTNNSYSKLLQEENKIIEDYIKREGISVTSTLPTDNVWPDNLYYLVPEYDNLYFHLDYRGDSLIMVEGSNTVDTIKNSPITSLETVVVRYKKFTLTYPSDTIASYWTTLDSSSPIEFVYSDVQDAQSCIAWHVAVKLMGYGNSQCTIICPSKQGFTEDQYTVKPYGYVLKIKIKR